MKKFVLILCAFAFTSLQAQVGINTTDPKAQLEIKATNQANPDVSDGIIIPKVDVFPAVNPTIDQDGMLVYLTTDVGANLKGFYYWDNANSVWKSISGDKGWSLTGNAGTDVATHFIGTTDNVGLKFKVNNIPSGEIDPILSNTSFGYQSAPSLTTGDKNTAFGAESLFSTTTGTENVALGTRSLYLNTSGFNNHAFGVNALYFNTTGNGNIANGSRSLFSNTIGNYNIAQGVYAMELNSTGSENTAEGAYALQNNTTASYNVAFGSNALRFNSTGNFNSAVGAYSLNKNTFGENNTAIGTSALRSNTAGTDNTAVGKDALYNNTIGWENVAVGSYALYNNIGYGRFNVAVGYKSLYSNQNGDNNTSIGRSSLENNVDGDGNTAIGSNSMSKNTTGYYNSSFGFFSLYDNTTGNNNCAFGHQNLGFNTTGEGNCSFGSQGMNSSTTGSYNCSFGFQSLYSNLSGTGNGGYGEEANPTTTTGWNNIGIGYQTLGNVDYAGFRVYGNQIGYDNIAFGLLAGDRIGNNCNQAAFIGPFSNVITNNTNVSNSTAVGNGALVFQNNMMRFGNSAITRIEAQVGLTVVSDGRYKFNVKEEVKGLDFIKKLRPVMYQYDTEKMDREWMNVEFDTMVKHNPQLLKDYQKSRNIRYSGFIAQEVEQAAQDAHYAFSGISKPENEQDHYGLDYAVFVVPLVKSIQEQQLQIEVLEKEKKELQTQIEKNVDENKKLQTQIKLLEKRFTELENLVKTP